MTEVNDDIEARDNKEYFGSKLLCSYLRKMLYEFIVRPFHNAAKDVWEVFDHGATYISRGKQSKAPLSLAQFIVH